MDCHKTLILFFIGYSLTSCSQFPPRKYYYIDKKMTWTDAQHFCREKYTDLATFESMDDINSVERPPVVAWIGLRDDPQSWKYAMGNEPNSWRWSATGQTSKTGYSNWKTNEPKTIGLGKICGSMQTDGKWLDWPCDSHLFFMCYNVTNETERTYVLIRDTQPWDTALGYCRTHYTDMAMIENAEEDNKVIAAKSGAALIWIGLYRVPWAWSDKSQSSFTRWQSSKPNNYYGDELCVADNGYGWDDWKCQSKYPFICHQVPRVERKIVRVKFQTDADISNPVVNIQILQELSAALAGQGWTDVNLKWRIQPRKLAEDEEESKESEGPRGGNK